MLARRPRDETPRRSVRIAWSLLRACPQAGHDGLKPRRFWLISSRAVTFFNPLSHGCLGLAMRVLCAELARPRGIAIAKVRAASRAPAPGSLMVGYSWFASARPFLRAFEPRYLGGPTEVAESRNSSRAFFSRRTTTRRNSGFRLARGTPQRLGRVACRPAQVGVGANTEVRQRSLVRREGQRAEGQRAVKLSAPQPRNSPTECASPSG